MESSASIVLPKGNGRGYGHCRSCGREYANRRKPKVCECGFHLGGSFEAKKVEQKSRRNASSVAIYETEDGTLRSVKLTPNDDRQFVFISKNSRICFADNCLDVRACREAGDQLEEFSCKHLEFEPEAPIYERKFSDAEIEAFTPDSETQQKMKVAQHQLHPSVVKVSEKRYAVICQASASHTMGYTHVAVEDDAIRCRANDCKKKFGRTKQVCIMLDLGQNFPL